MKIRNMLVGFLLVAVVGAAAYFGYRRFVRPPRDCEICGRLLYSRYQSTVLLRDSRTIQTCCPRCALHYEHQLHGRVVGLQVADRNTGEQLSAERAVYVEGSDDQPCRPAGERMPTEPGVKYDLKYDHCIPSLVAFKDESSARQFVREHGGRILNYQQTVASVLGQ